MSSWGPWPPLYGVERYLTNAHPDAASVHTWMEDGPPWRHFALVTRADGGRLVETMARYEDQAVKAARVALLGMRQKEKGDE